MVRGRIMRGESEKTVRSTVSQPAGRSVAGPPY